MKKASLALFFGILMTLTGCVTREPIWRQAQGAVWGTEYHIKYLASDDLADTIAARMRMVEMSLSPFERSSVITAINEGRDVATDTLIERVFAESQRVSKLSGGMFDPTVAPLINLWGFGYKPGSDTIPPSDTIASRLARVGIGRCVIRDHHIVKVHPLTEFNFSAITKGFGCDMVADGLAAGGASDMMVEIGGEVVVRGHNDRGMKWTIAVDAPVLGNSHEQMTTITLTDCGIATSGNYRNYRSDLGEKAVGHTISPLTGMPVETATLSATVIAPTCMTADALATACMAMEPAGAIAMVEAEPGAEGLLVLPNPDDAEMPYRFLQTSGFPELH